MCEPLSWRLESQPLSCPLPLLGSLYNATVVTIVLVVVQVDGCISWLYLLTRA